MEKKIASVIDYFAIFDYFPDFNYVYTFFPVKISKKRLKTIYEAKKYTVGEYSKDKLKGQENRNEISKKKLNSLKYRAYLKLISLFPQIKLVGLSGSISMMNANIDDDIDLFIITSKNRLFTGRFIALFLAQILGLRRVWNLEIKEKFQTSHYSLIPSHYANKVCLNLFFDERDLKIPKFKQTLFVGHEVLQMKPVINKNNTYEKFLLSNQWVKFFFPNVSRFKSLKSNKTRSFISFNYFSDIFESFFKKLQMKLINNHKTTELITNSQLWFHPDDFEKRIKY